MKDEKTKTALVILDEAIKLELTVSELYIMYNEYFPEDKDFWWRIAIEEKNHASLLESAKQFITSGIIKPEMFYENISVLKEITEYCIETIRRFRENVPDRREAYEFALKLEDSAQEVHFQQMMNTMDDGTHIIDILKKLNEDDVNHSERIKKLLDSL